MQTIFDTTRQIVYVLLLGICTPMAWSQIGPSPAEIPQSIIPQPVQSSSQAISNAPSQSEFVRPAIDEILLSKARAVESGGSIPVGHVSSDLNRSGSLPIGQSASVLGDQPIGRSTLVGSSGEGLDSKTGKPSLNRGYLQTIVSLAGVILLILGLGQVYKRLARSQGGLAGQFGAGGSAPSGIIEVIGRYPISKGMMLVVLKFDRRVLLLSHAVATKGKGGQAASMDVLCELSDAEDIASILLKARSAAGESLAQSFEQTLREADDITDEHLYDGDTGYANAPGVRFPSRRTPPVRTITTDEGDRAELWSSGQDSQAAAGVLRKRLATMRREQQG